MAFYVKMSRAPGECAREAIRQGIGVSAAVCMGYAVADNYKGQLLIRLTCQRHMVLPGQGYTSVSVTRQHAQRAIALSSVQCSDFAVS